MPTSRSTQDGSGKPPLPSFTFPLPPPDDGLGKLLDDDVGIYSDVTMPPEPIQDNNLAQEPTLPSDASKIHWDSENSTETNFQLVETIGTPLRRTLSADDALTQHASLVEALNALDLHNQATMRPSRSLSQSGPVTGTVQWLKETDVPKIPLHDLPGPSKPAIVPGGQTQPSPPIQADISRASQPETQDTDRPPPSPSSSSAAILQHAQSLTPVPRFHFLLHHTERLCQLHTHATIPSNIFNRESLPPSQSPPDLTPTRFASSLSAAQDASHTAQPAGPAYDDLRVFSALWQTTIALLDNILSAHAVLSLEAFGWGVYGLSSGLIETDALVLNHKARLHTALSSLPYLTGRKRARKDDSGVMVGYLKDSMVVRLSEDGRVHSLTSARRSVHVCAWLLVQGMRKEGWDGVRWGHGVRVCEGWMKLLGWEDEKPDDPFMRDDGIEEEPRQEIETSPERARSHRRSFSLM
ncbi:hypothetical protein BU24DRAFT_446054 [Aaosphaeria arxii CBS 175.79]|uniref:Uncharacterized protein n=1 Tax=Aaosphaeria arxii CBS 175.79 TaxID=1450172 RepID=A0A6A5Y854_9PLEO|nr:uncharacterized protein BU24DRAFT_446054 [Aaosphaeria arxii CBS 175.79]KAF2020931.1 hypothetical protein BU24DRAFT_446054 [Aaosphaeria arxii CBS 175.79]